MVAQRTLEKVLMLSQDQGEEVRLLVISVLVIL